MKNAAPQQVCAVAYVHHCYENEGRASVWALPGISDAESNDAPDIEEYSHLPGAVCLADKVENALGWAIANAAVNLLHQLAIESKLAIIPDD